MIIGRLNQKARESVWAWTFVCLGMCLFMGIIPFIFFGWIFHRTAHELAGLYIAYALIFLVLFPLIWWLRKWEARGVALRWLAHGWSWTMALFLTMTTGAVSYSAFTLQIWSRGDAVGTFLVTTFLFCPFIYFITFRRILAMTSLRQPARGRRPEEMADEPPRLLMGK